MAAVSLVPPPILALPNPRLPEMEARRVHIKEEGEGEERENMVGFPPDAPGSSLDNAFLVPSDDDDDDDETRSDDGLPSEVVASNVRGAPVTLDNSGGSEASHDDTPRQVNVEDGEKDDRAVESLPKTQGMSANTAIVIPEDRDEDEDDEEEEEDDYQLDAGPTLPLEINPLANHASGILEGGSGVSSASIPAFWPEGQGTLEDPTAAECGYVSGRASQANAKGRQQFTSRPEAPAESSDPPLVPPQASSGTPSLKRRNEEDDGDVADGQDTAETSDSECGSPVQLPSPPRNKPPVRSCSDRARAFRRANGRASGDRRKSTPSERRLLHRVADSDGKATRDYDNEDYSPSHAETARPQRKHRKISTHLHHDTIPSPVRRTRKRLTTRDSSDGQTAANPVQARYDEWPLHGVTLKRVMDGGMDEGRTVFQLQFTWDSSHHHRKVRETSLSDQSNGDISVQDTMELEEEEYEVEEILDWAWKDDKQQMEYLIKWEGYGSAENTWEPLTNLTQCQAQLAQFHRRGQNRPPPTAPEDERSGTGLRPHHGCLI